MVLEIVRDILLIMVLAAFLAACVLAGQEARDEWREHAARHHGR